MYSASVSHGCKQITAVSYSIDSKTVNWEKRGKLLIIGSCVDLIIHSWITHTLTR
jgi:hypothetical protein